MARCRYLLVYDIADPRRLRRVCTLMEDHGERLQYSVFLCDLTLAERAELEGAVLDAGARDARFRTEVRGLATASPTSRGASGPQRDAAFSGAGCEPEAQRVGRPARHVVEPDIPIFSTANAAPATRAAAGRPASRPTSARSPQPATSPR